MKRSGPLRRKKALQSTAPLRARKPLRARSTAAPGLADARREAFSRSNGRCEANWSGCQITAHHAHHRLRRSQGGGHSASNLLAVCWHCHEQIHKHPERAYSLGHLLRRTD